MVNKSGKVTFGASSGSMKSTVSGIGMPIASSTMIKRGSCPAASLTVTKPSSKRGFVIPALSVPLKSPPLDPMLEKLKKKTIRRNAPEGEDLAKIREIIRSVKGEVISVQEFVGLVSPYTGDNGSILCTVMAEDLSTFRHLAKQVYDTMTQDVSDVLTNEQIHLSECYNERTKLAKDKMAHSLREIYSYAPNFDFRAYYKDPETYLSLLFPMPKQEAILDPEDADIQRRQTTYHRLQWLHSEGARLGEENAKLQERLKDIKTQQRDEQSEARKREELAEAHKNKLEETEANLQDKLQDLNESVCKSIVDNEEEFRTHEEKKVRQDASRASVAAKKKSIATPVKMPRGEPWNVQAARSIEEASFQRSLESKMTCESSVSISSSKGAIKKVKSKIKRPSRKPEWQNVSPPPQVEHSARETSPFHYSPPRSPSPCPASAYQRQRSPQSEARGGPMETIRVETSETVITQTPQKKTLPRPRRSLAPRDSWGGF